MPNRGGHQPDRPGQGQLASGGASIEMLIPSRIHGSHLTRRWRGESAANSSLKMPNSLLAGSLQGISSIRASAAPRRQRKRAWNQFLAGQFPTHPNREFFAALQGIKSGDQGSFRRDQGIPPSSAIWRSPPGDKSDH